MIDSNGERAMTYSFTGIDMITRPDLVKYVLGKGTYGFFGDNDDEVIEYRKKNNLIAPIREVTRRFRERQAKKKEQERLQKEEQAKQRKEERARKRKEDRERNKLEASNMPPRRSERRKRKLSI